MDGITTYVVGIQISTQLDNLSGVVPSEQLDEVAILGGAPLEGENKFYSVEDQAALGAALDAITSDIGCVLDLGEEVDTTRSARLEVAGVYTEEVADCEAEDGWMFDTNGSAIHLCGQACADFQSSGEIELAYVCE